MYRYCMEREVPNSGFYTEDRGPLRYPPTHVPLSLLFSNSNISEMWENALDIAIDLKH